MIKPTKYPVGPDDMADLFDQASNQGKSGKQDTLVSGTNIKTINGSSLLGSGDLTVSSTPSWGSITGTLSSQSDLNTALNGKEPSITAGTTAQYYRGDKTFQTLDKSAVGLSNVDNTTDAGKPISTATQTALNAKQDTLVSGTSIKTVNSTSLLGSGDVAVQPTLVSGTNIRTVNGVSVLGSGNISITASPYTQAGSPYGSAVTGTTTNTVSASALFAAAYFASNTTIQFRAKIYKSAGTLATTVRLYINTANNLTGATLLATAASMTTAATFQHFWRDLFISGTSMYYYPSGTASANDLSAFTASTFTISAGVNYYLLVAIQQSNTTDSAICLKYQVFTS